MQILQNEYKMK